MITSYEVGAVFNIVDKASLVLKLLATQFGELDALIIKTQENLTRFSAQRFTGLGNRIKVVADQMTALGLSSEKALGGMMTGFGAMGKELGDAAGAAKVLKTEMAEIAAMSRRMGGGNLLPGSGGGHRRPGQGGGSRGGGGPHFGTVSAPLPGGSHLHMGGSAALAGLGMIGYGVYEEAQMEDAVFQLLYHTGMRGTAENKDRFRNIIQKAMSETGYDLKEVAEAAKTESRMFQGVPGGGLDVMPELLRAAAIESRLKGSTLKESMDSLLGLAHMTKEYSQEDIKKLAPAFAFLSAANPASLGSMEKAASYAVPILQSGLEIDPMESLLLGTVMTRAGATNTKSGTWLRNMLLGAMPGSSIVGDPQKHHDALARLGLIDANNKPTWFTDNKPDPLKMLDIAGEHAANIPLAERAATEKQAFGVQGFGAFALLADPAVKEQLKAMREKRDSPEFKNQYASFMEAYSEQSPVQKFRETWQDLKTVLMDIGSIVLPSLIIGLKGLDEALKWIKENINPAVETVKALGAAIAGLVPSASDAVKSMFALGSAIKNFFGGILDWLKNKIGSLLSHINYEGPGVGGGGIIHASWGGGGVNDNGGGGGAAHQNAGALNLGGGGGAVMPGAIPHAASANVSGFDPVFAQRMAAMMAAAKAAGVPLSVFSGYRSQAHQNALFAHSNGSGHWVARHSNHTRGIAADLRGNLEWAHRHAHEFGLKFPMPWERWHIEPQESRGGPRFHGHVAPYVRPHDSHPQALTVMLDGDVIHRSVVKHERRATEHSHQAPTFDGYHDFSAPDGQIWAA